jgi:addiction module HigA family antidote
MKVMEATRQPVHPGEILREEFLAPLEMSAYRLAQLLHVPQQRITDIIAGNRGITADTALRLGRYFFSDARKGAQFWLSLQASYDLDKAMGDPALQDLLEGIEPRERV